MVVGSNDTESARLLQQNYLVAGGGLTILLLLMMGAGHFSCAPTPGRKNANCAIAPCTTPAVKWNKSAGQRRIPEAGRLLFQNSGEGMMVTDAEGVILTVNPAFSLLSGYTEKELIGHHAYELTSSRNDKEFSTACSNA
jgi:PAS domain-containing protein